MKSSTLHTRQVWFERAHTDDLKQRSLRGGLNTFGAELVSYGLRVGSIIVLARLLMPEHFGLVGMVTAMIVFAERFKDLGLDIATVQRDTLTHEQVSTLFWINVAVGSGLMLAVAACAPLMAAFYGEPPLVGVAVVLAFTFLFGGAAIQHQALLRRRMRFGELAAINVGSTAVGFATGLTLAWYGYGYWALVWKEVARSAAMAAGAWMLCPWVPGRPRRDPEIRSMMHVGGRVTGFNIVYFLTRSLDQILIGRVWGAGPLGFYRQGHQLLMLPFSLLHFPVDYVALPALTAVRHDPDKYRRYYREITSILAFVTMPMVVYLAIYSQPIVSLLLGAKWLPAAPLLSVMAIAGFVWPLGGTTGMVMLSTGRSRRYFRLGMANGAALAAAFGTGVHWGPLGVAVAYAVYAYATVLPFLWLGLRGTPVSIADALHAGAKPAFASLCMAAPLLLLPPLLTNLGRPVALGLSLAVGSVSYLTVWCALPGGRRTLGQYVSHARAAIRQATRPSGREAAAVVS